MTYRGPPKGAGGREARQTGVHKDGRVIIAEQSATHERPAYNHALHRMREVELVLAGKYGKVIPEALDATGFLLVIGCALKFNGAGDDLGRQLHGWCARFAPHLLASFHETFEPIRLEVERRRFNLSPTDAGRLIGITWEQRSAHSLKTMDACDISKDEQKKRVAKKRREENRVRKERKRRAANSKNRAAWLSEHSTERKQPWRDLNIGRSTYYDCKKRGLIGSDGRWTGPAQGTRGESRTSPAQDPRTGSALTCSSFGCVSTPVQIDGPPAEPHRRDHAEQSQCPSSAKQLDLFDATAGAGVSPPSASASKGHLRKRVSRQNHQPQQIR
jgi:hypothetical protein